MQENVERNSDQDSQLNNRGPNSSENLNKKDIPVLSQSQGWQASIHKKDQQSSSVNNSFQEGFPHEEERANDYPVLLMNQDTDGHDGPNDSPVIAQQVEMFSEEPARTERTNQTQQLSDQDSILNEDHETAANQTSKQTNMHDASILNELERLIINLNHMAMDFLRKDQFNMAIGLLNKAEANLLQVDESIMQISQSVATALDESIQGSTGISMLNSLKNKLLGLTYNNLGCVSKQQQDYHGALEYLKKALIYESAQEKENLKADKKRIVSINSVYYDQDYENTNRLQLEQYISCNTSGTILNICAILSKLNRHLQAYEYAMQAITNLKNSMSIMREEITKIKSKKSQFNIDLNQLQLLNSEETALQSQWINIATTTVIAYYNAAVESEFTGQWKEALELYREALYLSQRAMVKENPMTPKIQTAILKVKVKVRNKVQLPQVLPKKPVLQNNQKKKLNDQKAKPHSCSIVTAVTNRYLMRGAIGVDLSPVLVTQNSELSQKDAKRSQQNYFTVQTNAHEGTPSFERTKNFIAQVQQTKVNSGEAKMAQTQDSLMSETEQYTDNEAEFQKSKQNESKDVKYNLKSEAINIQQMSMFKSLNNRRLASFEKPSFQAESINQNVRLKTGSPKIKQRKQKSITDKVNPLSLQQIINKLEKQKIDDFNAVNQIHFYRNNRNIQTVDNQQEKSLQANRFNRKQDANFQTVNSGKNSPLRNQRQSQLPRQKLNSRFGKDSIENQSIIDEALSPKFLPKIQVPPCSAGMETYRTKSLSGMRFGANHAARGYQGTAFNTQRQTGTNINKKRDYLKNAWIKGELISNAQIAQKESELPLSIRKSLEQVKDQIKISETCTKTGVFDFSTSQHDITSNQASTFARVLSSSNKRQQAYESVSTPQSYNFRVSPISIQVALSQEEERKQRYLLQKSIEDQKRHDREVKFFSDHFFKQSDSYQASVYTNKPELGLSALVQEVGSGRQKSNFRQQYEKVSSKITAAVYLPDKLKKALKKEHMKTQLKEVMKMSEELNEKAHELKLNQQLERAFQEEISKWKNDQEQLIEQKIKSYEEERQLKEDQERKRIANEHAIRDEKATQEIQRLNEYARSVEAAHQEADRQLKEKEKAIVLQTDSFQQTHSFLKDNDVQTDFYETLRKSQDSVKVQKVDVTTSIQGLSQNEYRISQNQQRQSQAKSNQLSISIQQSQKNVKQQSSRGNDSENENLSQQIITGHSEIMDRNSSMKASLNSRKDALQIRISEQQLIEYQEQKSMTATGCQRSSLDNFPDQSRKSSIRNYNDGALHRSKRNISNIQSCNTSKIDKMEAEQSLQTMHRIESGGQSPQKIQEKYCQEVVKQDKNNKTDQSLNFENVDDLAYRPMSYEEFGEDHTSMKTQHPCSVTDLGKDCDRTVKSSYLASRHATTAQNRMEIVQSFKNSSKVESDHRKIVSLKSSDNVGKIVSTQTQKSHITDKIETEKSQCELLNLKSQQSSHFSQKPESIKSYQKNQVGENSLSQKTSAVVETVVNSYHNEVDENGLSSRNNAVVGTELSSNNNEVVETVMSSQNYNQIILRSENEVIPLEILQGKISEFSQKSLICSKDSQRNQNGVLKPTIEVDKPLITFGIVRVWTNTNSDEHQIVQSSEAVSEMLAKLRPQTQEHDQSNFFLEEGKILSEKQKIGRPQYSSIKSIEEIQDKQTITDLTELRQSAPNQGVNLFSDISIVCEEDISNWQAQHIGNKASSGNNKINESQEDETLINTELNVTNRINQSTIGEGPIFIQRKTSYRIKEEWESQNESRLTHIQTSINKPPFTQDLGIQGVSMSIHDLTQRPFFQSKKTSIAFNEKKVALNNGNCANQYAMTLNHQSLKSHIDKPLERIKTQTKVHDVQNFMSSLVTKKTSLNLNQDLLIRQSLDSKTDGTEYFINPTSGKHIQVRDWSQGEDLQQSRSDFSQVTVPLKINGNQSINQKVQNYQSSCFTHVQPVLNGKKQYQVNALKTPQNQKDQTIKLDMIPKHQQKPVKVMDFSLNSVIKEENTQKTEINDVRFAKIAGQIQKLNLSLEQFQHDLQQQKADPVLKSTRRSIQTGAASSSIKSENSANRKNVQQKRIQSEMQYAQDMSQINQRNLQTKKLSQTGKVGHSSKISQNTLPKQEKRQSVEFKEEVGDHTEEPESVKDILSVEKTPSEATQMTNAQRMPTQKNQI